MVICLPERITMNKNKNAIHDQKHLTLSDRTYIEQELSQGSSFKSIATVLPKDPTTISKEVRLHREITPADRYGFYKCRGCMNYSDCQEHRICRNDRCKYACRYCD